jgi:hypothetical protein
MRLAAEGMKKGDGRADPGIIKHMATTHLDPELFT